MRGYGLAERSLSPLTSVRSSSLLREVTRPDFCPSAVYRRTSCVASVTRLGQKLRRQRIRGRLRLPADLEHPPASAVVDGLDAIDSPHDRFAIRGLGHSIG